MTPDEPVWRVGPGAQLIRASWLATGAFTVAATAATVSPGAVARAVAVLDVGLFLAGTVAFLLAFGRAVSRSRVEAVDVLGVYFLGGGVAPPMVRRALLGSAAAQTFVAVVSASIRPYSAVAFGVLVPMLGLGLAGVWGATHGRFPSRHDAGSHVMPTPEDRAD